MNTSTQMNNLIKTTQHDDYEKGDHLQLSENGFNLKSPISQDKQEEDDENWITEEEEFDDYYDVNKEEEKEAQDEDITLLADIIQGFSSSDPKVRQKATLRAESLMKEDEELVKVQSTVRENIIFQTTNKNLNDNNNNNNNNDPGIDGEVDEHDIYTNKTKIEMIDFLQDLSLDELHHRKATRSQRKQKSDGLRKQGNLAFARKDYDEAVKFYTRAIDLIRDSSCLYINRAFAYIKLTLYEPALEDCEKAIFISEFSLKARLYKCKVLSLLQRHEECLIFLEETRKVMPFHKPAIDHCEQTLFESEEEEQNDTVFEKTEDTQGNKARDDIFSTEKYMRLASQFKITQMENFFEKNKSN